MSLPSSAVTLSDGTIITMGMRDAGMGNPVYLKVHASRPSTAQNAGASPLASDDGVAIAAQLGLGTLQAPDAKLLSDMLAKVRT